ncbi:MAG: radical SAM protein [Gammaproteobacteria bacterium]|nr:radical SAM protein [Gammaproteobacteria bacterium]MDH5802546.1 radical SAM protein [Gammaproteobacteria bacterium]
MYSPITHLPALWLKRPVQLTFFLTRRCNAHCPYCFYLQSNDAPTGETKDELQLPEIEQISASMKNLLWLAFSGGEIFLRRDLVEISKTFYRHNHPVYMLFPTNGQNPDRVFRMVRDIAGSCVNSNIIVKLSIDDLYEEHDRLRATPRSFEKTLETYAKLSTLCHKHSNLQIGVNTVFCAQNQDRIDAIIDFVSKLSAVKTHTLSLVRGDLRQKNYKHVDMEKYRRATQRLAQFIQRQQSPHYSFTAGKLKIAQDVLQRRLIDRTMRKQDRVTPCYAGSVNLVLSESGEVYPCELQSRSMGNIKTYHYRMDQLLRDHAAKAAQAWVKQNHCFCSHECHMMTNILANPARYPAWFKEYVRLFHAQNPLFPGREDVPRPQHGFGDG